MATYYIDSDSFSTATAVYVDAELTIKATDGYYSFGGIYRFQYLGFLLESHACGTTPPPPPPPPYYLINVSNSVPSAVCGDSGNPTTFPIAMYSEVFPVIIGQTVYYDSALSIVFEGDGTWYWYGSFYAYKIDSFGIVLDIVNCEIGGE